MARDENFVPCGLLLTDTLRGHAFHSLTIFASQHRQHRGTMPNPVSYTHLDVYKRQASKCIRQQRTAWNKSLRLSPFFVASLWSLMCVVYARMFLLRVFVRASMLNYRVFRLGIAFHCHLTVHNLTSLFL